MDVQRIKTDADFSESVVEPGKILVFSAIENGTPVTRYKDSDGNFGTIAGGGDTDTSDATATAEDIAEGKTAYIATGKVTGTLVPSSGGMDFYKCAEVFGPKKITYYTVSGAGTTDCNGKYEDSGETQNDAPVYSYASSSGTTWYLYYFYDEYEGGYWIISTSKTSYPYDAPYFSSSITSGWSVGSGSESAPTVTATTETINADQPQTWNGYKAVLADGVYTFEETATAGLTYGTYVTPVVGEIYNADSTVMIHTLKLDLTQYLLLSVNFSNSNTTPEVGTIELSGNNTPSESGIRLTGGYIKTGVELETIADEFTIMAKVTPVSTSRFALFAAHDRDGRIGIDSNGGTWNIWAGNSGWNILQADSGYSGSVTDSSGRSNAAVSFGIEQTVVFTHKDSNWDLYVNGNLALHKERSGRITTGGTLSFNRWGGGGYISSDITFSDIKVFSKALIPEEIAAL